MKLLTLLLTVVAFFTASSVEAARVTPMVVDLEETGQGSIGRIEISNTGEDPMPIEVLMFRGVISEAGELDLIPADDQFLVFPPQTVIPALRQQIIRVQYIGTQPLEASEVYYASVREVPNGDRQAGVNVQIVATFNVLVNVVPEGTQANVSLEVVGPEDRDGQSGIAVRVVNTGDRYFAAGRTDWSISGTTADGETYDRAYRAAEMGSVIGYGIVPAGGARRFFVPTPEALDESTLEVRMSD